MSLPRARLLIIGLLFSALVFHLVIVAQDFSVLAGSFLYDDSFYAFKIAHNIANGHGVSFDGVHPTDGFQPLYVFSLVPFYWLSGSNLTAPIYAALVLSALLTALTATLLFLILRRYVTPKVAVLTTVIWAFSPVVTKQAANGLETSLALFLFAAVVYFYLSRIRSVERPSRRDFVLFGVLVGLSVLARIDEVLLSLVIALDYLLVLRRRGAPARAAANVWVAVLAALIVYSPWLVFSAVAMGNLFQDSGTATRYLSMAYAPFFGLGSADMAQTGPDAGFLWGHVVHSFSVMKLSPPFHAFFRGVEKLGVTLGMSNVAAVFANAIGFALVTTFVYLMVFRRRGLRVSGFEEVQFLLLYSVSIIAAYSLYVFGVFFFVRYYYPVYFIVCIFAGLLLEEGFQRLPAGAAVSRSLATSVLVMYLCVFGYMAYRCTCRTSPVYCFYDVASWVDENTSPDDTIGVFQSGAIGYFSKRKVINLDGKVNSKALDALRNGQLPDYLRSESIDVIVDNKNVLDLFLVGDNGKSNSDDAFCELGLIPIMDGMQGNAPGWAAYRVNGFAKSQGGGNSSSIPHVLQNR